MASFAEMIYGTAEKSIDKSTDGIVEAGMQGAELALKQEQLMQQKAQLQQKKAELENAKIEKFVNAIQAGANYKGQAKTNYYNKAMPIYRDSLGLTDQFPDDTIKMIAADDLTMAKFNALASNVRRGDKTAEQAIMELNDPVAFAKVPPEVKEDLYDQLGDAEKVAVQAESQRNSVMAQNMRQEKDIASTGKKEVAKKVADEYSKYEAVGGAAGMSKAEEALQKAINQLQTGAVTTGGKLENIPYGSSLPVMARLNKPLKTLRDSVLSTQNIKALSGDPNPTQMQIEAIESRILDPMADNQTNIKKLQAELNRIRTERAKKESQFIQQGFMQPQSPQGGKAAAQAPAQGRTVNFKGKPTDEAMLRAYLQKFPNGPDAAEAKKALGE